MSRINIEKVLFVCSGNIFRSPFAAYYFNQAVKMRKITGYSFSRGTNLFYTEVNTIVLERAGEFNIDLKQHKPVQLNKRDLHCASSIVSVDVKNYRCILDMDRSVANKLFLLGRFLDCPRENIDDVRASDLPQKSGFITKRFLQITEAINNLLDGKK